MSNRAFALVFMCLPALFLTYWLRESTVGALSAGMLTLLCVAFAFTSEARDE